MVNPLFLTNSFILIINIIFKSRLKVVTIFINEKNLQKLGRTGELISPYLYNMIIFSFKGQSMVLELVK